MSASPLSFIHTSVITHGIRNTFVYCSKGIQKIFIGSINKLRLLYNTIEELLKMYYHIYYVLL